MPYYEITKELEGKFDTTKWSMFYERIIPKDVLVNLVTHSYNESRVNILLMACWPMSRDRVQKEKEVSTVEGEWNS